MASPLPPRPGLVDTEVLRDIHAGVSTALTFALDLIRVTPLEVSEYSVLVVLQVCPDPAEVALLARLLRPNRVHSITAPISRRARRLLESLTPPAPLTPGDAIAAATAIEHSLPLYTLDPGRFAAAPGLTALQPY